MDEHLSNLDLVEMGRRFAAIRKHLGLSQTDVANEIGTFQITISKIESGSNIMSPVYLKLLVFYSQTVSLDKLFERDFDIKNPDLFNKKYESGPSSSSGWPRSEWTWRPNRRESNSC